MRGAIAAGSPLTVKAGLEVLRDGGNAVDAAIASTFMACVAEPLLTGLGGAGLAMVRMNGEVSVCDFFSRAPGRKGKAGKAPAMETIELDFGPTTQVFHAGAASTGVPGLTAGLDGLSERYGRLPLSRLVQPAIEAARAGVVVTPGFRRVLELLWPILATTPGATSLFSEQGSALEQGALFRNPDLAEVLEQVGEQGATYFSTGV
ncbi:MAG: gamma-glutamyltransferase, partial [Myxococcota bacterium]|nr:gamma-glutamyltransferase [Myxococcota bacterium]